VAPAVAPIIGGALLELAGWRSIFVFLALFGAMQTWLTWRFLPESLPEDARQPLHPVGLARAYGAVLSNRAFMLLSLATALNFNGFFLYVMSAPVFIIDHLGLGSTAFGWLFVPGVAGMMAGSMLAGRLAGRWSTGRTIAVGYALMLAAGLLNVALSALLPAGLPQSVLPIPLFTLGMAMAMPSLSLLALDLFPARRGMASSCQSFLQMGLNAAVAGAVVPLLWGSTLSLAAGMCLFAGLGLFAFLAWARRAAA